MKSRQPVTVGPVTRANIGTDPNFLAAQRLQQQGVDLQATDIPSGLNKALSQILGAYQQKQVKDDYATRDQAYGDDMSHALGFAMGTPQQTDAKSGITWNAQKPDMGAASRLLMNNPDTADMGLKFGLSDIERNQALEAAGVARQQKLDDYATSRKDTLSDQAAKYANDEKLAKIRAGAGQASIDPVTGEIIPGKPKLSATEQKEFFEADDRISAGQNVIKNLESALAKNDTAYSGTMADERAWLASNVGNLFGKDTPAANATVDMKNLVTGQALEGLKTIFGGNPTEGERGILLELQASTEKTPAQRKAILERGIEMANRRLQRDKSTQEGLKTGQIYNNSPAQSVGSSTPAVDPRALMKAKGMSDEAISAYLAKKGFK